MRSRKKPPHLLRKTLSINWVRVFRGAIPFFRKLLCRIGVHRYNETPIIAALDHYWLQGGKRCVRCSHSRITFTEASNLINHAYERGKDKSKTQFMAYGAGVKEVVRIYGKTYVQAILDKEND